MTTLGRIVILAAALGLVLGIGGLARYHWRHTAPATPRVEWTGITVSDSSVLIASRLIRRRQACAIPIGQSTLDVGPDGPRYVVGLYLVPCLRAIGELPCAVAGRWTGAINATEPDAPRLCRALYGQPPTPTPTPTPTPLDAPPPAATETL